MADTDLTKEINTLKRDLDQLQKDFGKLAEDTGNATKQAASAATAKLEEEGQALLEKIRAAAHTASETSSKAVSGVQERIEEKPLVAASTALGIGFVLGMLISRKS